jgi:hypothetical protein
MSTTRHAKEAKTNCFYLLPDEKNLESLRSLSKHAADIVERPN